MGQRQGEARIKELLLFAVTEIFRVLFALSFYNNMKRLGW